MNFNEEIDYALMNLGLVTNKIHFSESEEVKKCRYTCLDTMKEIECSTISLIEDIEDFIEDVHDILDLLSKEGIEVHKENKKLKLVKRRTTDENKG